jgi:uncharacterized protein (TIGR02145 family)
MKLKPIALAMFLLMNACFLELEEKKGTSSSTVGGIHQSEVGQSSSHLAQSSDVQGSQTGSSAWVSSIGLSSYDLSSGGSMSSLSLSSHFQSSSSVITKFEFKDSRDQKTYMAVHIGKQVWMAQNLDYGVYVDSEDKLRFNVTVQNLGQKFCWLDSIANCERHGGLYQWNVLIDGDYDTLKILDSTQKIRGICPSGWHIPRTHEWEELFGFAGGIDVAARKLRAIDHINSSWDTKLLNAKDTLGFGALPLGCTTSGRPGTIGFAEDQACYSIMSLPHNGWSKFYLLKGGENKVYRDSIWSSVAYSVRCIKD